MLRGFDQALGKGANVLSLSKAVVVTTIILNDRCLGAAAAHNSGVVVLHRHRARGIVGGDIVQLGMTAGGSRRGGSGGRGGPGHGEGLNESNELLHNSWDKLDEVACYV